ncbi:MAG TPA: acyl-CoA dehydrogenase family protein [Xanthobacteraceae bacterium]
MLAKQDVAEKIPSTDEIIARARAMIPALRVRAMQGERERRIPTETIAEMQAAGLFKVLQPRRWGGYEMDMGTYFEVQMALGEGDMSVAWVYGVVGIHPWFVAQLDEKAEQEIWGEDNTTLICSSLMPAGIAKPVEGGFRLGGTWKYASGCEHCAWAFLGGTVEGKPDDRRVFAVPRKDYRIVDTWHVPGLKSTGSHDITAADAFVPEHRTQKYSDSFNGVAPGRGVNPGPLYRLPFGQVFFRGVSTGAIGALKGMLDAYLEYGKKRIGRASGTPASEEAIVQLACAEIAVAIDEMKTILHRNFRELERYAAKGELPPLKQRVEYKFHNAVVAERCSLLASRLFKAAGTAGIAADLPFGRILSDITVGRQHISNQFEQAGKSYGAFLFGIENNKDFVL